jgi:hypothetical protein
LPGQAVADTVRTNITDQVFEIQQADGTPVGTVMAHEVGFGMPPPGAPSTSMGNNKAITGGTGAFLGARGQMGANRTAGIRIASVSEDPANRRTHGGGTTRHLIQLIPMSRPEIVSTPAGPAVFHADFSPVTPANPATAGEILILRATGLGPTRPAVELGRPFPADAFAAVNSPLTVEVNGRQAQVINAIGWPGLTDTYRVDFRVPDEIPSGVADIQLTAAWISGSAARIVVR